MGYNKPNPLKMMDSALKMYKAEKKGGMHRMESPMYAKEASRELKDMPIVDIEKGDAKGSPAKAAKPDYIDIDKDGNTTESMKDAAKAKGSPAKASNSKTHQHNSMSGQARHDHMKKEHSDSYSRKVPYGEEETKAMQRGAQSKNSPAKAYSKGASGHGYTAGQYAAHQDQSIVKQNSKHVAAHSGSPAKKQGYNDRLDESLAKDGKESSKKQSMKDRRDESKGMKKSKGKGAYSSDPKMS